MQHLRRIAVALNIVDPHPNHQDVFAGVTQYAHERGDWQCFIDEHPAYRVGQRRKARGEYDGVIARADPDMQKRLKAQHIPLVNTLYHHHKTGLAGVYMDPVPMGQLAAEHLISRGFRRFYLVMDPIARQTQEVARAFIEQIQEDPVSYSVETLPDGETTDPAFWVRLEKEISSILAKLEPPAAVFIDSAISARMLVELCQHRGLHVPQDVAVLCLRNPTRLLEIPTSISSIQDNYHQVGYEAAVLLGKLMDGQTVPEVPLLLTTPGIAARASTDHFAADDPLVAEALRYISSHLAEPLPVEQIADALSVSVRTLYNKFETVLGRTIASEIRRLRINSARVLLSEMNLSVQQVSRRSGFGNSDVMARVFKKQFGMTPAAFREQLQRSR